MRLSLSLGPILLACVWLLAPSLSAARQQPPVFRGRVALVPIDVRVLDRDDEPVRDLVAADFRVFEDGIEQAISHFSIQDEGPEGATGESIPRQLRDGRSPALIAPAVGRSFIIVLGRGRLQGPAKGFDALLDFIDDQILPTDRIAVAAYDRISELTTDRRAIRRLIQRYRSEHDEMEALLDHWFRDLTVSFGAVDPPPSLQARIERLFDYPGLPRLDYLENLPVAADGSLEVERERILESLGRSDTGRRGEFILNAAARQDMERLLGVVEHLRYVGGEKHVIFVTNEGMLSVQKETSDRLIRMATDARITLSTIQTGGVPTRWVSDGDRLPKRLEALSWKHVWANADTRTRAEQTGGVASTYEYAAKALDRIERATRFQYILGYYPKNAQLKGDYRRITIQVSRPEVRVLYRHGYYARNEPIGLDRREYVTGARIEAAASYRAVIRDIPIALSASAVQARGQTHDVRAVVRVPAEAITFSERDGRHIASLDVALFVGARNERQIGELRKRVDLQLKDENYAAMLNEGLTFSATVTVTGEPRHVKAVVYEYTSDRLGTGVFQLAR